MSSGVARVDDFREVAKARGDECFRKVDYEGALSEYNAAIEWLGSEDQAANYYHARGNALERLGRLDEALTSLRKALHIRKKAVLYGDLADTYRRLGFKPMAEKYYRIAILMDPSNEKYKKVLTAVGGNK